MDKEKYDKIVKPFAYARVTPYVKLPEWKELTDSFQVVEACIIYFV